jgi:hypothetical protein
LKIRLQALFGLQLRQKELFYLKRQKKNFGKPGCETELVSRLRQKQLLFILYSTPVGETVNQGRFSVAALAAGFNPWKIFRKTRGEQTFARR